MKLETIIDLIVMFTVLIVLITITYLSIAKQEEITEPQTVEELFDLL